MKWIRLRVIILAGWFVFFYIIGRQLHPNVTSNITIGLMFVVAAAALVISRMSKSLLWAILLASIATLLVIRYWAGGLSSGQAIFITFIEACAIVITATLSFWARLALEEFEDVVADIIVGQQNNRVETALSGQGLIYREVRRARNHQRPLALISIGVDEKSINPADERMVEEVQRSMVKQYKLQGLSKMLCDELEDCAVIVQNADHYLAALPETKPEEVPIVVERLRQKASHQAGVEIKVGVATLSQDNYTFEGLIEKATREMENDREPQPYVAMEQFPLERRIN